MSSLSSCKSISVRLMYSPGGCWTTLGRSFITIFCGATKCTTRCTYHLWTLWLAGPDLDNVLIRHVLHMALPITNIMPVLLFLKRDRFSYTPWYLVLCLHGRFMVLNTWLKALQIKPYGFHLITMGTVLGFLMACWHNPLWSSMMGHTWRNCLPTSPQRRLWYTALLQKLDVNARGLNNQHPHVLIGVKYLVGLWHNWF